MSREQAYTAFVLKRQDYNETDQILTLFTKEDGKLRALVKASKLPTSKLQPSLQPLFKVGVTLAGNGGLPKVIGAQVQQSYPELLEENKLNCWYLISELLTKALGDGSPNESLFQLVEEYLDFLQANDLSADQINLSALQFQTKSLKFLGMGIMAPQTERVWFSVNQGGFIEGDTGADAVSVAEPDYALFQDLAQQNFDVILNYQQSSKPLSQLINRFMTYQLERELKAAQFMNR